MPINLASKARSAVRPRKTKPAAATPNPEPDASPTPVPVPGTGPLIVAEIFPTRTTLHLQEVAKFLTMTDQQVSNLIEDGELAAVNIAGRLSSRKAWRIPSGTLQEFIDRRKSV